MKKGWKIFWITCASIAGLGIVLSIAGAAMGATFYGVGEAYASDIEYRNGVFWGYNDWDNWKDENVADEQGEHHGSFASQNVMEFQNIRELELEVSYLQVIISRGDTQTVRVDSSGVDKRLRDRLYVENEEGKLTIEDSNNHSLWNIVGRENGGKLIVELPKKENLNDVSLNVNAGQLTVDSIETGTLDIHVGAGQVIVRDFVTDELELNCGAGQARLDGTIKQNAEIDCGVGEVELNLTGNQKDYNYELKCGDGELRIGNQDYSGLGNTRTIDNRAGKLMDVNCGIGNVSVAFEKDL